MNDQKFLNTFKTTSDTIIHISNSNEHNERVLTQFQSPSNVLKCTNKNFQINLNCWSIDTIVHLSKWWPKINSNFWNKMKLDRKKLFHLSFKCAQMHQIFKKFKSHHPPPHFWSLVTRSSLGRASARDL